MLRFSAAPMGPCPLLELLHDSILNTTHQQVRHQPLHLICYQCYLRLGSALAPLLRGESGEPALVLSTDAIRAELFGDAAVQGPWDEIRSQLLRGLKEGVAAGRPVIVVLPPMPAGPGGCRRRSGLWQRSFWAEKSGSD